MMTIKKDLYTYEIEIVETMSAIIEVVAEDDSSAILEARERYRNEDIELNYDDLIDTKFNIFGVK
ncbi:MULTISPECIES: DpnD/PcfM family protein [unclassified Psychrobacter]